MAPITTGFESYPDPIVKEVSYRSNTRAAHKLNNVTGIEVAVQCLCIATDKT